MTPHFFLVLFIVPENSRISIASDAPKNVANPQTIWQSILIRHLHSTIVRVVGSTSCDCQMVSAHLAA
jgi:hypothetical protein